MTEQKEKETKIKEKKEKNFLIFSIANYPIVLTLSPKEKIKVNPGQKLTINRKEKPKVPAGLVIKEIY